MNTVTPKLDVALPALRKDETHDQSDIRSLNIQLQMLRMLVKEAPEHQGTIEAKVRLKQRYD